MKSQESRRKIMCRELCLIMTAWNEKCRSISQCRQRTAEGLSGTALIPCAEFFFSPPSSPLRYSGEALWRGDRSLYIESQRDFQRSCYGNKMKKRGRVWPNSTKAPWQFKIKEYIQTLKGLEVPKGTIVLTSSIHTFSTHTNLQGSKLHIHNPRR